MKKFSIVFALLSLFFFVTGVLLLPVFSNAETTFLLSFGSAEIKMTGGKNLFVGHVPGTRRLVFLGTQKRSKEKESRLHY